MATKKKVKRFRAVTAVKELARERVGTPPAEKIVVEKKKKPEKHKPTLSRLLGDTELMRLLATFPAGALSDKTIL